MNNRERYDRLAPVYDAIDLAELTYKRRLRPLLFAGLGGLILDAGAGTGRNVPYYPRGARVVAFDASPAMLARARRRARRCGGAVELAAMDVVRTALPGGCFDAVVAAFLFGVLDPALQRPALAELARVCKPCGEVRILDYTYSAAPLRRLSMRLWLPWQRLVYGGGFDRHTERYMSAAGLELVRADFVLKDVVRLLVARPTVAEARAPAAAGPA